MLQMHACYSNYIVNINNISSYNDNNNETITSKYSKCLLFITQSISFAITSKWAGFFNHDNAKIEIYKFS